MSETLFSSLPRYDAATDRTSGHPAGGWQTPFSADPAKDAVASELRRAEPEESAPPVNVMTAEMLGILQIESSLAALSRQLDRIERDARMQALEAVRQLSARLFPELSRQFLAEEICRHLSSMVPASAAVIELKAAPDLAETLRIRIDALPLLANRCSVTPVSGAEPGRAEVSWQSGGLAFDFDGLLAACLSQLSANSPVTKE